MTRDEIIRMAREAGFHCYNGCVDGIDIDAIRFAAIVSAAEREACAEVCQGVVDGGQYDGWQQYAAAACRDEIRARGEKGQS